MAETQYREKYTGKAYGPPLPDGTCRCGCGALTSLSPRTDPRLGLVKGLPVRYRPHHYSRSPEGRAAAREYGRLGKLAQDRNNPPPSAAERLAAKLAPPDAYGCRHFVGGALDKRGYGRINDDNGKSVFAHRLAYRLAYGEDSLREGESVHHMCVQFSDRSASCCNPEHLIAVSHREHMQMHALLRAESPGWSQRERHGECRNGHPRAEHGFIHSNGKLNGKLDCRACQRESDRRKRAKRRVARAEAQWVKAAA